MTGHWLMQDNCFSVSRERLQTALSPSVDRGQVSDEVAHAYYH